jgi:hypothetical protein
VDQSGVSKQAAAGGGLFAPPKRPGAGLFDKPKELPKPKWTEDEQKEVDDLQAQIAALEKQVQAKVQQEAVDLSQTINAEVSSRQQKMSTLKHQISVQESKLQELAAKQSGAQMAFAEYQAATTAAAGAKQELEDLERDFAQDEAMAVAAAQADGIEAEKAEAAIEAGKEEEIKEVEQSATAEAEKAEAMKLEGAKTDVKDHSAAVEAALKKKEEIATNLTAREAHAKDEIEKAKNAATERTEKAQADEKEAREALEALKDEDKAARERWVVEQQEAVNGARAEAGDKNKKQLEETAAAKKKTEELHEQLGEVKEQGEVALEQALEKACEEPNARVKEAEAAAAAEEQEAEAVKEAKLLSLALDEKRIEVLSGSVAIREESEAALLAADTEARHLKMKLGQLKRESQALEEERAVSVAKAVAEEQEKAASTAKDQNEAKQMEDAVAAELKAQMKEEVAKQLLDRVRADGLHGPEGAGGEAEIDAKLELDTLKKKFEARIMREVQKAEQAIADSVADAREEAEKSTMQAKALQAQLKLEEMRNGTRSKRIQQEADEAKEHAEGEALKVEEELKEQEAELKKARNYRLELQETCDKALGKVLGEQSEEGKAAKAKEHEARENARKATDKKRIALVRRTEELEIELARVRAETKQRRLDMVAAAQAKKDAQSGPAASSGMPQMPKMPSMSSFSSSSSSSSSSVSSVSSSSSSSSSVSSSSSSSVSSASSSSPSSPS